MGLPPPARGSRLRGCAVRRRGGSTPACAGITYLAPTPDYGNQVYPRLRGDHVVATRSEVRTTGLPPPARGSPQPTQIPRARHRSTPVCAGITVAAGPRTPYRRVYPRLRGDHPVSSNAVASVPGLPPPARGSRAGGARGTRGPGSTPACAGITIQRPLCRISPSVYPRLRGDHAPRDGPDAREVGLPPPARGSLPVQPHHRVVGRSTPACAGITARTCSAASASWVYPRLRGDHSWQGQVHSPNAGLPPPARGSRHLRAPPAGTRGSTPACAGITPAVCLRARRPSVYPRLRGDHSPSPKRRGREVGLPPPARGSRDARR